MLLACSMYAPWMLQQCITDASQMLRDSFTLSRKTTNAYSNHPFFALTTNHPAIPTSHIAHFSVVRPPIYPFRYTIVPSPKITHRTRQRYTPQHPDISPITTTKTTTVPYPSFSNPTPYVNSSQKNINYSPHAAPFAT